MTQTFGGRVWFGDNVNRRPACLDCDETVSVDAYGEWDMDAQAFALEEQGYDTKNCPKCGDTDKWEWKEVQA